MNEKDPAFETAKLLADLHARIGALEAGAQRSSGAPAPMQDPKQAAAAQKDLESAIDRMVANALLHGRRTSGVLSGMFNLSPGLSGR